MKYCWPLASIPQIKCSFIKSHICAFQKIVIIMFSLKCTNTIPKDGDHWRYGNWNVKWFDQFRWTDGQCLFLVDFGTEFFVLSSSVVISITIVVVIHIFPFFPSFYILNILILPIAITINSGGDMHMHCASEFCVWFICSQFYGIKLTFKMKNYEPELSIWFLWNCFAFWHSDDDDDDDDDGKGRFRARSLFHLKRQLSIGIDRIRDGIKRKAIWVQCKIKEEADWKQTKTTTTKIIRARAFRYNKIK